MSGLLKKLARLFTSGREGRASTRIESQLHWSIEPLEAKELLTSPLGLEGLDAGVWGQDAVSGEWRTIRYDGSNYVAGEHSEFNTLGHWSESMAADLDGDGLQELYLRNTSTGDWWRVTAQSTGGAATWVAHWAETLQTLTFLTGDITGDGRDDLISFDQSGEWYALSNVNGNFVTTYLAGWGHATDWQHLSLVDFHGDGAKELIAQNTATGVWWSLSKSGNSYTSQSLAAWTTANTYDHLLTGDVNGDGRTDVITQDSLGNWWGLFSNGQAVQTQFLQGWNPSSAWKNFTIADLEQDGTKEIIAQDGNTGFWWEVFSTGASYSSRRISAWSPTHSYGTLLVGDVSGDGRTDLVLHDELGGWWSLGYDGQTYRTTYLQGWNTSSAWRAFSLIDVNGTGQKQVVGWDSATGNWWGIFQSGGIYVSHKLETWGTSVPFSDVIFGNFLSNPGTEVLSWDAQGTWWSTRLNTNAHKIQRTTSLDPRIRMDQTHLADVNGDGRQDLLGWEQDSGIWWALIHDESGPHSQFLGHLDPATNWEFVTIADLDGDGRDDIAQRNPVTGEWFAVISPLGISKVQRLTRWNPADTYTNLMTGDVDGDGRVEIIARNGGGDWWSVTSDGTQFRTQFLQGWTPSWNWKDLGIGDLDGDGREDIFGRSGTTGTWWRLHWTGSSYSSQQMLTWNPSLQYSDFLVGDVTGDGRDDLVARDSFGTFSAVSFNGTTFASVSMTGWASSTVFQHALLADLDGDQRQELILQDHGTHNWWGVFKTNFGYGKKLLIGGEQDRLADQVFATDLNFDGLEEIVGYDSAHGRWWQMSWSDNLATVQTLMDNPSGAPWINAQAGLIPGISDSMLRAKILKEIPELSGALAAGDKLFASWLIMKFAAVQGDFALQGDTLAPDLSTVSQLYFDVFQPDRAGMSCGGYAAFFSGVLDLFEIDSLNIGFGMLPTLTHSTVVIPLLEGGVWKFYFMDPTFGAAYFNPDNHRMATLFDLVDFAHQGRLGELTLSHLSLDARDYLSHIPVVLDSNALVLQGHDGANYLYTWPGYGLEAYFQSWGKDLIENGFSADLAGFVELFEYHVLNLYGYGTNGSAAATAFIQELQTRLIPYGA